MGGRLPKHQGRYWLIFSYTLTGSHIMPRLVGQDVSDAVQHMAGSGMRVSAVADVTYSEDDLTVHDVQQVEEFEYGVSVREVRWHLLHLKAGSCRITKSDLARDVSGGGFARAPKRYEDFN